MRKLFYVAVSAGCIMLYSQEKLHGQTHNKNLHETVTHGEGGSARVEGAKNKNNRAVSTHNASQENTMPQNDKEFGYWTGSVTVFKHAITVRLAELDRSGLSHGMPFSTYDYMQWTKNDLKILATAYNGVELFEMLNRIKTAAGAKSPTDQLSQQDIEDAQRALEHLKPNSCANWMEFGKMIHSVAKETEAKRAELKERKKKTPVRSTGAMIEIDENTQGMLIDLEKFKDIAGSPLNNPAFDQQAALQTLKDKEIVLTDAVVGEKKPLETLVTDAVKNIKGAVRAA